MQYRMEATEIVHNTCTPVAFFILSWYFLPIPVISVAWQHIEHCPVFSTIQSDELSVQKKLRTEVIQLEDTLAQVRKEYEMLRIEFEQNLAANEQAGTV